MPPARVATIGLAAGHRVEQRRAEAFGDRAHHEQIEPLDAAEDVGAEAGQQHVLLEVMFADLPLELLAQLAFAEDDEPRVRDLLHDQVRRFDRGSAGPCAAPAPPTLPTTGAWCGSQNASCTFTGGAASTCSTSMPSWTVTVRSAGTPSATSICRIASDAAMKQSTCRYFQRENELPFRWKSTRRDATSAGAGRAPTAPSDSASAAMATPCGSCAWTRRAAAA